MVTGKNMSMAAGSRGLAAAARLSQSAAGPSPALLTQLRCAILVLQLATILAHDGSMVSTSSFCAPQSFCDGPGVFRQALALHRGDRLSRRAGEQPRREWQLMHTLDTNVAGTHLRCVQQRPSGCLSVQPAPR